MFFNTVGTMGDAVLWFLNPGTIYGDSSEFVYFLNAAGADPNFGREIYSWIRLNTFQVPARFIASKPVTYFTKGVTKSIDIPSEHINHNGYTIIAVALDDDYNCNPYETGFIGIYGRTELAYLEVTLAPPPPARKGQPSIRTLAPVRAFLPSRSNVAIRNIDP